MLTFVAFVVLVGTAASFNALTLSSVTRRHFDFKSKTVNTLVMGAN